MSQTVYIDTSVVGGAFDEEFQFWTELFLTQVEKGLFKVAISNLLEGEIMEAPEKVIELFEKIKKSDSIGLVFDKKAEFLSQQYLEEQIVGIKSLVDCQHIATATINKIDILISWNFKHIVNLDKIRLYNAVNLKHGYMPIEIRTPREILK